MITNEIEKRNEGIFYEDCFDGKNVYNHLDDAIFVSYENKDNIQKEIIYEDKAYTLDLVLAEKEINYYYDYTNNKEMNSSVNALIRNIYEEKDGKLVIKDVDDATLGIKQYHSEYYLTNLKGKYFGYGNNTKSLNTIDKVIKEYNLFEIKKIDNEDYVKYFFYSEDAIEEIAGKYYDNLKDNYLIKDDQLYFKLQTILDLK